MLICCRYERLLTSVNPLIRWNQGTFMVPSGTRLDDLLLTSWPGSQSHMRRIFFILCLPLWVWSGFIYLHLEGKGWFIYHLCVPKKYPTWTTVNCHDMSAYKQIIVCCVKVPSVLQLLCPFLPAKTSILHGGWSSKSFFPQTCAQCWYHVKHLHGSVWPLLGCY